MRYLFLLWGDEAAELALPAAERQAIVERHVEFTRAIRDEGREVSGEPLGPSRNSLIVRRNGSVTDGPYLETKEQLGGFYILDVENLDEALKWAAKIPHPGSCIELRPVIDFSAGA
jgi:hypothetical protein